MGPLLVLCSCLFFSCFPSQALSRSRTYTGPSQSPLNPLAMLSNGNRRPLVAATYYFNSGSQVKPEGLFSEDLNENQNQVAEDEDDVCLAPDGRRGSCYDANECVSRGGMPMGKCPSANGGKSNGAVCCLFEITCGEFASERFVYFRNPGFPAAYESPRMCRVRVGKQDKAICQYRVDLLAFDLAPPNRGNCSQDIFVVSGQNENHIVPKICGLNSGHHYYFGVDESGVVSFHVMMLGAFKRKFNILISQIPCHAETRAPSHCLQYYTGTHGLVKSFNYDEENATQAAKEGYPNNIDYIMCVKKESGFCSITYELSTSEEGVLPFAVGSSALSGQTAWPIVAQCRDDFLIIGGIRLCSGSAKPNDDHFLPDHEDLFNSQSGTILNATLAFPTLVTDFTPGPFMIRFVSNQANNARGFSLGYRQNPCK